jgi:plasmid stabilization system protein ParE
MSYELSLSKEAQQSIEEQLQWYESDEKHGGTDLADRWLALLETALNKLTKNPQRYGPAPENGRWRAEFEVRQLQFRPWKTSVGWRVLFVIDDKLKVVTVLQVRHERRRWLFEAEGGPA